MIIKISSLLDYIADRLETKGLIKEALDLDRVADAIDSEYARIEKQLEDAYSRRAPQSQINHLETELAKLVSEGGLDESDEDLVGDNFPATSEGHAVEEELRDLYHQYLSVDDPGSYHTRQEILEIMRGALHGGLHGQRPVKDLTDAQILDAARDVYEHRIKLTQRRNTPHRVNKTPGEALKNLDKIKNQVKDNRQL